MHFNFLEQNLILLWLSTFTETFAYSPTPANKNFIKIIKKETLPRGC